MKNLLKDVSYADYPTFREEMIKRCKLTNQQYNDRKTGRVRLSLLEHQIAEDIVEELNNKMED